MVKITATAAEEKWSWSSQLEVIHLINCRLSSNRMGTTTTQHERNQWRIQMNSPLITHSLPICCPLQRKRDKTKRFTVCLLFTTSPRVHFRDSLELNTAERKNVEEIRHYRCILRLLLCLLLHHQHLHSNSTDWLLLNSGGKCTCLPSPLWGTAVDYFYSETQFHVSFSPSPFQRNYWRWFEDGN